MATTGEAVLDYLWKQTHDLHTQAPAVVNNDEDAVHELRLATRRLRSGLAAARKLFNQEKVSQLRSELKWLGDVLGAARDPQVIHERIRTLLAAEPQGPETAAVGARIDEWFQSRYAAAHAESVKALGSQRYRELLKSLDDFLAAPGAPASADGRGVKPAAEGMGKLAGKQAKKVKRQVAALPPVPEAGQESSDRDKALHEVRKSAKRLRYVAEAAEPSVGKPARRLAKQAHKVQQVLGVHQDTVVARALLHDLGTNGLRTGEDGFSYGRLHAREEAQATASDKEFGKVWKRLASKRLRAGQPL